VFQVLVFRRWVLIAHLTVSRAWPRHWHETSLSALSMDSSLLRNYGSWTVVFALIWYAWQSNVAFSKPVRWSQFFYVDRFILLTSGFTFSLYKYYLDTATRSDLQRWWFYAACCYTDWLKPVTHLKVFLLKENFQLWNTHWCNFLLSKVNFHK